MKNNILAVASVGGHNVQLRKLISKLKLKSSNIIYVNATSNNSLNEKSINSNDSYIIQDVSRDDFYLSIKVIFQVVKIIYIVKPRVLITTGALPGLISILVARTFGIKTIWVDSIANSRQLSFSGKLASYISKVTLTQWPNLVNKRVKYQGNILE